MEILLILPYDSTYRYKSGSFKRALRYPPLTLTTLASLVPVDIGAKVRIIDEGVDILEEDIKADLVGISAVTATAPRAYLLADKIRKKGIPVVLGGVHPTIMPEEALEHADSVVVGFAEESWPQLLRDFKNGDMKKIYAQSSKVSLRNLPFPRRDLLNKNGYVTVNTVMATRGCPHKCEFCVLPVVHQYEYYRRPIDDVINEIRAINAKIFIFLDANPNADASYAKSLYDKLAPLKKEWVGLTTIVALENEELLQSIVKSGCKGLLIGFETISQTALCEANKKFNLVNKYADTVKRLHDNGIKILGCFMFGFDHDDKSIFEKTYEFISRTKIDFLRYTIYTPFPGTTVYNELKKQGRIIESDWSLYDYEHVVFKPARMTPEELKEGIIRIWNETYSLSSILKRVYNSKGLLWLTLTANFAFKHHAKQLSKAINIRDTKG